MPAKPSYQKSQAITLTTERGVVLGALVNSEDDTCEIGAGKGNVVIVTKREAEEFAQWLLNTLRGDQS